MAHMTNGNKGPIKRSEYDSIPFRNSAIDTLKRVKMNNFSSKVKDVEVYDPKTGKSEMIYKPAKQPNAR